jgi:hypothetical protein
MTAIISNSNATRSLSMEEAVAGLLTKSDKIRALTKAGYSRTEIADFLGIRYQHVRNVQVNDERVGKGSPSIQPGGEQREGAPSAVADLYPARVRVEADGYVLLPKEFYRALGLKESEPFVAALEHDSIRLMSVPVAVKRAQAIVRRFVPVGVSLVDELIAERRAEAKREDGDE